jgi:hypothetical protein
VTQSTSRAAAIGRHRPRTARMLPRGGGIPDWTKVLLRRAFSTRILLR